MKKCKKKNRIKKLKKNKKTKLEIILIDFIFKQWLQQPL